VAAVQFGIYVNNRAAVFLGAAFSLDRLLDAAVAAEAAGFDFVSVGDSILAKPRYMPIPVLSAIAARTRRVKLATGILQPHMRHPVLLAEDWATLDALSAGRTILGVGLGTGDRRMVEREYELVGIPKARRGQAFDEAIRLLKRLWTEEHVTFEGEVFRCQDVTLGYRPLQAPHPPIVIACGGYVPAQPGFGPNDFYSARTADRFTGPFERVARLGDGWMTGIVTVEEYRATLTHIRTLAHERHGRALGADFLAALNCFVHVGPDATARQAGKAFLEAYHQLPFDDVTLDRWLICGAPARCAERIRAYVDAGVNMFQFVIASPHQVDQIQALAAEVLPLVGAPRRPAADSGMAARG
jgi:alkanesulfonate monooxygenase SsuD/methylene tetrahydromethanopterin reductase-like flavin-dependent oxidoreductase (luciferase family)